MAGLLQALQELLDGAGLDAQVSVQVEGMNGIGATVQALVDGPSQLLDLESAIGQLPVPPGLSGIGRIASGLAAIAVPGEAARAGPLAPILGPLNGLAVDVNVSASVQITAVFDLVREIAQLATGRVFGGASGMAEEDDFSIPELPDPEQLRAFVAEAGNALDALGPSFDAPRILELIQRAAAGFRRPLVRFPPIPVLVEMMEALDTIATWQTLAPAELSAHLARTVEMAAQLIRAPREKVADPVLAAAAAVTGGAGTLEAAAGELGALFPALRAKVIGGSGKPSAVELRRVEAAAETIDRLTAALDPATSPLSGYQRLPQELTRTLLCAVRALQPAFDVAPFAERLRAFVGEISAPGDDVFQDVVTAIEDFDLSAVTDPLQTVRQAVETAVTEIENARNTVRDGLVGIVSPVADALDAALAAAGFADIQRALDDLPGQIQSFVDTRITPNLDGVRQGIAGAVDAVSTAGDSFDPDSLVAPIRDAVEQAAALLRSDEVASAFADVEAALAGAIDALGDFDLAIAADASIDLIGDIEGKVSEIDPSSIPDAAKPVIEQAVKVVADIDFSVEVSAPISGTIQQAVVEGPGAILGAIEQGMDEVRSRVEAFRPSQVIGDALDRPFEQMLATLREFKPSDLLGRLQQALDAAASQVQILDVGAVVDPLVTLHGEIEAQVQVLRPSNLLQPVEAAVEAAVARVFEAAGVDTVLDGIDEVLAFVQTWTGLVADARDLLARAGDLFAASGDASAQVESLVDAAVDKLDEVDLGRLEAAFAAAGAAVASVERNRVAGDLAPALQSAGERGPQVLAAPAAARLKTLARSFPLAELEAHPPAPARRRLAAAVKRLRSAADRLDAAAGPWGSLGPALVTAAGDLQQDLLDYHHVVQLEGGGAFAQLAAPPASVDELKASVRAALADGLGQPLTTVVVTFQAFAPFVHLLARGLSDILGAAHAKIDEITGDAGIGGAVGAVEDLVAQLRDLDLSPITDPLDDLFGRVETAIGAIDPEPLRAALNAARDAVAGLLSLSTLIDPAQIDALDAAYAGALEKIGALAPGAVISATVDPVFEELLADLLPILDLPARLRLRLEEAGRELGAEVVVELARVEAAFDEMLRAIPLATGSSGASASASASVSIG